MWCCLRLACVANIIHVWYAFYLLKLWVAHYACCAHPCMLQLLYVYCALRMQSLLCMLCLLAMLWLVHNLYLFRTDACHLKYSCDFHCVSRAHYVGGTCPASLICQVCDIIVPRCEHHACQEVRMPSMVLVLRILCMLRGHCVRELMAPRLGMPRVVCMLCM